MFDNLFVEGDNITYSCSGSGETNDSKINVCGEDGQWSLQTLPACCKCLLKCLWYTKIRRRSCITKKTLNENQQTFFILQKLKRKKLC